MNGLDCIREQDALDALCAGRWPHRCDAELRAHIASCEICADVIEVARAFQDEQQLAVDEARVPGSGLVWWRAQMRARQEAAREAVRPISLVQAVTVACAIGGTFALLRAGSPWLEAWAGWLSGAASGVALGMIQVSGSAATTEQGILPVLALGAWLVLAPVAVYLAVTDE